MTAVIKPFPRDRVGPPRTLVGSDVRNLSENRRRAQENVNRAHETMWSLEFWLTLLFFDAVCVGIVIIFIKALKFIGVLP